MSDFDETGSLLAARTTLSASDAAEAAADPRDLFPVGSIINGRYRVEAFLGAGGMGTVSRITDLLLPNRALALKTIPHNLLNQDHLDLLKAEFRTMSAFRHPNVASVFDFEPIHGTGSYCFTMEFVEGRDIYTATESADVEMIVDLLVQICRALAYIHSRGVIHFDLKPSNVFVTTLGRVKVLDFGIAGTVRQTGRRLVGTPAYMAPELADIGTADHRADLYAAGIILYQLLARRLPFEATRVSELLRMHGRDPIDVESLPARGPSSWRQPTSSSARCTSFMTHRRCCCPSSVQATRASEPEETRVSCAAPITQSWSCTGR